MLEFDAIFNQTQAHIELFCIIILADRLSLFTCVLSDLNQYTLSFRKKQTLSVMFDAKKKVDVYRPVLLR